MPKLLHDDIPPGRLELSLVAALLSAAFLMRYLRDHDRWALNPFAYYCIAAGLLAVGYLESIEASHLGVIAAVAICLDARRSSLPQRLI